MKKMVLKRWQKEAYEMLKDEQYRTINALTGAGKSYLMMHMAVNDAINGRKSVICVPQEIISASFIDATPHTYDDRDVSSEEVQDIITNTFDFKDKSSVMEQFLKSDKSILICSYQTFLTFYEAHPKYSQKFSIYIDEAHHIKAQDSGLANNLGGAIFDLVKGGKAHITLSSATLFRGDKIALLDPSIKDKFVRYNLDVDAYLKEMKYLKNIEIDVQLYPIESPFQMVKENYRNKKTIIYVPYVSTQEFKMIGTKKKWVRGMISAIKHPNAKLHGPDANGIYEVKNGGLVKVLDLVTHDLEHRKAAKKYLIANQKNEKALDIILALGMMKEGANFVHASESFVFGARNSIVEVVQIMGRILRDAENKKSAKMTIFVPKNIETSGPQFKSDVENYVKATLMNMIIEDVLYDGFNTGVKEKSLKDRSRESTPTAWGNMDSEDKMALMTQVSESLLDLDETASSGECMAVIQKEVDRNEATKSLDDEDKSFIAERIFAIQNKNHLKQMGKHVNDVDYEVIKEQVTNPMGWMLWTTREFGIKRFADLRAACGQMKTYAEWLEFVKPLGFTFENQWMKYYKDNPELKGLYPAVPSDVYNHKWEQVGKLSGTYEQWLALIDQLGFTYNRQWRVYFKAHPELKGIYPAMPSSVYNHKWEEKGYPEYHPYKEWIDLINKLGFTQENQWMKYYKAHPELKRVYPAVPARDYNHKWEQVGKLSGTYEQWLAFVKPLGFTCQEQWVRYWKAHPELRGVYASYPSSAYNHKWEGKK